MLQNVTEFYRVLQSVTEYYRVLQSISSASTWTNFWACSASHTYLREDKKKGELTQAELIILNFRLDLIPLNLTFIFHSVADSFSGCYCESCVPTLAKAVKYQSCCKILSSARKYFFSPEVGIGICFGATGNVLLS